MQTDNKDKYQKSVDNVKAIRRNNIIFALLLIILGINFVVNPVESQDMLIKIICVICILSGIIGFVFSLLSERTLAVYISMFGCALITFGAIYCIMNTMKVYVLLHTIFGVFIIFNGVYQLIQSFIYSRRVGSFVFSAITMLLGIIVFLKPEMIVVFHAQFTGISLIVAGASFLWLFCFVKPNYVLIVEENENGETTVQVEGVVDTTATEVAEEDADVKALEDHGNDA